MFFRTDSGASIFTDICGNDSAQPEWFEFASAAIGTGGEIDTNSQMLPRTLKWKVIDMVFRMILRLGISRSDLVMGLAYAEQSTGVCATMCVCMCVDKYHRPRRHWY